jgi:hypothetical protein
MNNYESRWNNTMGKWFTMPEGTPAEKSYKSYIFDRMSGVLRKHVKQVNQGTIPLKFNIMLAKLRGDPKRVGELSNRLAAKQRFGQSADKIRTALKSPANVQNFLTAHIGDRIIANANKVKAEEAVANATKSNWKQFGTVLGKNKGKSIALGIGLLGGGVLLGNALSKKNPAE